MVDWRRLPRPYRRTGRELPCGGGCGRLVYQAAWQARRGWTAVCSEACRRARLTKPATRLFDRWTRRSAYVFGLLLSDGHVSDEGYLSFVSNDEPLSRFVAGALGDRASVRAERLPSGRTAWRVQYWSLPTVARLANLGLTPRKSLTLQWPEVPAPQVWDFIRGLLDGDGSVDQAGRINFSTGSADFAAGLAAFLSANGLAARVQLKRRAMSVYLSVPASRLAYRLIYRPGFPFALTRKRVRVAR